MAEENTAAAVTAKEPGIAKAQLLKDWPLELNGVPLHKGGTLFCIPCIVAKCHQRILQSVPRSQFAMALVLRGLLALDPNRPSSHSVRPQTWPEF
ncbi:hypothetical protein HDF10_000743 [Edaphobacter lichenicola]|uniref:Uncharacterized protein n=1 Tax=Tunturiibacter lichenicola TaxID=2051959 RepID=A0A7W8J593_9BACT|nr:hypothetical protein [Edaphobacter lichenicola]